MVINHLWSLEGRKAESALAEQKVLGTNIQISAELGIEPGSLWLEGRDLTNCAIYTGR